MKIETMRKIDYGAGIPLSFLFSIVNFLTPLRPLAGAKARKILFIELSEMGSAVLVDPALQLARKKHAAELYFVIFKRNKISLDILKTIPDENIFVIRDTSLWSIIGDAFRFMVWCQKKEIEATVDLELFSRATALLSFLSRCSVKVGFHNFHGEGLYRGHFLTHAVAYNPHIHIAKNFVALVEAIYAEPTLPLLKQEIPDSDILMRKADVGVDAQERVKKVIQKLFPKWSVEQPIILVNPNASEFLPQRKWPLEKYTELIRLILNRHPGHLILLTGSPSEREEIAGVAIAVGHPHCINFAGEVPFLDLIPLYTLAKVLITNDSGPGHFSSVTEIKSFVFFGPETPLLYGSLGNSTPIYANYACSPCVSAYNHRKTPCHDNQCLKVIQPETVYKIVQSSL
jgi:ADP-heptose:LPS heptosyltransferase